MHPVLVRFTDNFFIGSYGALIALGLLAAIALAAWRGKPRGFQVEIFFDMAFLAIVSGFIGGRILYIFTEWQGFINDPMPYILSRTGFVFLGGLTAATATCTWYVRKNKIDFWKMGDMAMPSVALGHAFGRIGCHFAGCCFGGVCTNPMGIRVPMITDDGTGFIWPNAFEDHLRRNLVDATATSSLPVWPVQLMEAGSLFLLTLALVLIGMRPHRKGLLLGLYLVGYGIIRFLLEMLRGDEVRGLYFGGLLSTSQILSIVLLVIGAGVLATQHKREVWGIGTEPVAGKKEVPNVATGKS